MLNTLSTSWILARASGRVLLQNRALLVFPLLSGVASIGVVASFVVPAIVFGAVESLVGESPVVWGPLVFAFYLVQYFVAFYFNAALVGAALLHLDGQKPTLRDGLVIASDHAVPLLGYAALSATVGMILGAISRKTGILGKLLSGSLGIGWSLASFLAVPVLVTRDIGPIGAVRESAALLRSSWGEQVTGRVGMKIVFGLAGVLLGILSVLLVVGMQALNPVSIIPTVVVIAVAWIGFGVATAAIRGVFQAAVFRHAVHGEGGVGFEGVPLDDVIRTR